MPLQTEQFTRPATTPGVHGPRGGSYVTLPAADSGSARTEGTYVTCPAGDPGNGDRVRGHYVTLPGRPQPEAEGSYVS